MTKYYLNIRNEYLPDTKKLFDSKEELNIYIFNILDKFLPYELAINFLVKDPKISDEDLYLKYVVDSIIVIEIDTIRVKKYRKMFIEHYTPPAQTIMSKIKSMPEPRPFIEVKF